MQVFSDISLWWLIPICLLSFAASFAFYWKQKQVDHLKRPIIWSLILLRFCSLFLLILLLIALVVESKEYKTERPVFITLLDESSSMKNYADSAKVVQAVKSLKERMTTNFSDRFELQFLNISNEVRKDTGHFEFSGSESNLEQGFEYIYNQYFNRNVGGIVFISDGNFNSGVNPIYAAEKIPITPIFSIGVGDTIVKRDQLISNVGINDVAFLNNEFPIEVDLKGYKLSGAKGKVSIRCNGKIVDSKNIDYRTSNEFQHVSFKLKADKLGFVQYSVELEDIENESSYKNNKKHFYIEVIDSRNKVLMLANAPHPDMAAIRQELEKDENAEVETKLINEWDGNLEGIQLLIWHNPKGQLATETQQKIQAKKIPTLYILPTDVDAGYLNSMGLSVKLPRGRQIDEVQGDVDEGFQLFTLSDELKRQLKSWPPLSTLFGGISVANGEVLIKQRIGQVVKKDPILFFGKRLGGKFGVLIGEGLWKWRLTEFAQSGEHVLFNELIQKTSQYLTVKQNSDPLRIKLPKRFKTNQEVRINATFYNSSFEQITTPAIQFVLKNSNGEKIDYVFAKNDIDYSLSLGVLSAGNYEWSASCNHNGKTHKKTGVFVVDDLSVEVLNTHANHQLLKQIALNSNGEFYRLSEIDQFIEEIGARKDIVSVTYEEATFDDLIDWKTICFIIVLLLGTEWFIRRYSGSY